MRKALCVVCLLVCGVVWAESPEALLAENGIQGGLVVHLGCDNGKTTLRLHLNDAFMVHGLDTDAEQVAAARDYLADKTEYGPVSVDTYDGKTLPYVANSVNFILVDEMDDVSQDEIMRVLTPNGVAVIRSGRKDEVVKKPWPDSIDEWTHYFHGPDNNPVANDTVVAPPKGLQWVGSPRFNRHHDHTSSMPACVSAGGRLFYIMDEGSRESIQLPSKWTLVARDAFNGTILWKRSLEPWLTSKWACKSGPSQLMRRLVAVGDKVYVTIGLDAPVSELDAATGKTLRTFDTTNVAEEIVVSNEGQLYTLTTDATRWNEYRNKYTYVWENTGYSNSGWSWDGQPRMLKVIDLGTGKLAWEKEVTMAPMSMAVNAERVCYYDGKKLVSLSPDDGSVQWTSEPVEAREGEWMTAGFGGPRLILHGDFVAFAGGKRSMSGLSAKDGSVLWTANHPASGHLGTEDLMIIGDRVWCGALALGEDTGIYTGRDVATGDTEKEFPPDVDTFWFHHRCYPSKATVNYLLPSRTGIEFVDWRKETWDINHWVRGSCVYGIMPCNGLTYAPPHPCACYPETKLYGFNALAPQREEAIDCDESTRLEKGPAYGSAEASPYRDGDWPTYRGSAARSGYTDSAVPAKLSKAWQVDLGGRLSSVAIADGKLFVAAVNAHTLYALGAASGDIVWQYTTGGRIDSPPTIYDGRAYFGCADGYVYALRASDGVLVWRFRAAPMDRRAMAFEQLESLWPVHGSVLVYKDELYTVAGRSMFLDGGLRFLKLNPVTGEKLVEVVMDRIDPESGKDLHDSVNWLDMAVGLPDVLSAQNDKIYMRSQQMDLNGQRENVAVKWVLQDKNPRHLFAPYGYLDSTWFHRSYWLYGSNMGGGWGGWPRAGFVAPYGRILSYDGESVFAFGRKPDYLSQSSVLEYWLYAADPERNTPENIKKVTEANKDMDKRKLAENKHSTYASIADPFLRGEYEVDQRTAVPFKWHEPLDILVHAMVVADDKLIVAGPPDVLDEREAFLEPDNDEVKAAVMEQEKASEGAFGSQLMVLTKSDGKQLAAYKLDSQPIFDGMAVARGKVYLAMEDGNVLCMTGD